MSRAWAMPNAETFSIRPIKEFVGRWTVGKKWVVDPFARNSLIANVRNDLDPATSAQIHVEAEKFIRALKGRPVDVVLFDPPYSPRQISEVYKGVGLKVGNRTRSSFYTEVRDAIAELAPPVVLSFGWNSVGIGKSRGYELCEVLLVCHGGAHNDTICIAETRS